MLTKVPNDIFWNRIAPLLAAALNSAASLWLLSSLLVEPIELAAALGITSNVLDLACAGGGLSLWLFNSRSSQNDLGGLPSFRITNQIRRLRFDANEMTQKDLAAAVGITRQTMFAIENAKDFPSLELAFQIARHFNTPLEQVFQFEAKPDRHQTPDTFYNGDKT